MLSVMFRRYRAKPFVRDRHPARKVGAGDGHTTQIHKTASRQAQIQTHKTKDKATGNMK